MKGVTTGCSSLAGWRTGPAAAASRSSADGRVAPAPPSPAFLHHPCNRTTAMSSATTGQPPIRVHNEQTEATYQESRHARLQVHLPTITNGTALASTPYPPPSPYPPPTPPTATCTPTTAESAASHPTPWWGTSSWAWWPRWASRWARVHQRVARGAWHVAAWHACMRVRGARVLCRHTGGRRQTVSSERWAGMCRDEREVVRPLCRCSAASAVPANNTCRAMTWH